MGSNSQGARFALAGVSVRFGASHALDGIDLEIGPGEAVGLVGPSGCGKTTLLRLLNGTVRPTAGTVAVDGHLLSELSPGELRTVRRRIGAIHQDLDLVPELRVLRNVLAGGLGRHGLLASARLLFAPPRAEVLRVHALLERVGLGEKLYTRADQLSGGQRQRVAIARALYQDPAALLPDEPISSLDPARAHDMMRLLLDLSRDAGITLVTSLHDLDTARAFLPRLVGLRRGRVIFDRPAATLVDADFQALYDLSDAA